MIDFAPQAPKPPPRPEGRKSLPPAAHPRPHRHRLLGTVVLLGFAATAAGGAWLWQQQQQLAAHQGTPASIGPAPVGPAPVGPAPVGPAPVGSAAVAALDSRLDTLQQRVVLLEQRPAPTPFAPLEHRLGLLDERLARLEQRPAPAPDVALEQQLGTLDQRLTQLEQRPAPAPDAALEQRLTQLEQRPAAAAPTATPNAEPSTAPDAPVEQRLAALEQRLAQLEQRPAGTAVAGAADVRPLEQRLAQAEQAISTSAARAARLHAVGTALEAGRPLGDLPGAPPALARFATASPPTEAALRLAFPVAAGAAARASDPATAGLTLPWRMWQQVQTLFTLREGDKILVGAPATSVLAQAQARLDAGDLPGAVATLDQLDAAAAKAIASWREQAQSLLDARVALAGLARS